jgi:hypothetical protein
MRTKFKQFIEQVQIRFRKPSYSAKVFCIGYNKTGTTSCGKAFELLGYRNISFKPEIWRGFYKKGEFLKLLNYASKFDSFDDLPWLKEDMIPLLDKVFPNSKFVYLEREEASWLKSLNNWSYKRTGVYPDLEKELVDFKKHQAFVKHYFRDRPDDLLSIDVTDKKAFMKLATFLGKETSEREMPHENKNIMN